MFDFEAELRASFVEKAKAKPKQKKQSRMKPGTGKGIWNVDDEARESHKLSTQEKKESYQKKIKMVEEILKSMCQPGALLRTKALYNKLTFDIGYCAVSKLFHNHMRELCRQKKASKISNYSYRIVNQNQNGTKL